MGLDSRQDEFVSQLYREMYYQLMAYAKSALANEALAEEAVQDAFRIACAKIGDLMGSENPRGWIVLTLKNVIRNTRRELASLNNLVVDTLSMEDEAFVESRTAATDITQRVEDSEIDILYSDLLTPDEYKLLKLIALHRYTMLEAAEEFGISVETCKKRVQRTKEKLRKILEKDP